MTAHSATSSAWSSSQQGARATRAKREQAALEESMVDFQAELDVIAIDRRREAETVQREIRADEVDDLERFRLYQALEKAVRSAGGEIVILDTFHALVAHVEQDERLEDESRRRRIPALVALIVRLVALRRTFHGYVPLIRKAGRA
jgi:hypothetical protein